MAIVLVHNEKGTNGLRFVHVEEGSTEIAGLDKVWNSKGYWPDEVIDWLQSHVDGEPTHHFGKFPYEKYLITNEDHRFTFRNPAIRETETHFALKLFESEAEVWLSKKAQAPKTKSDETYPIGYYVPCRLSDRLINVSYETALYYQSNFPHRRYSFLKEGAVDNLKREFEKAGCANVFSDDALAEICIRHRLREDATVAFCHPDLVLDACNLPNLVVGAIPTIGGNKAESLAFILGHYETELVTENGVSGVRFFSWPELNKF